MCQNVAPALGVVDPFLHEPRLGEHVIRRAEALPIAAAARAEEC